MKNQEEDVKDARKDGLRIPIEILVDYKSEGSYLFDFCRDLSTGGVFIETQNPKKVGEEFELTFTIPDNKETITAKGKVIWVQEKLEHMKQVSGMGVQFLGVKQEEKGLLEQFVSRYSSLKSEVSS